jgi:hypothetical protein
MAALKIYIEQFNVQNVNDHRNCRKSRLDWKYILCIVWFSDKITSSTYS